MEWGKERRSYRICVCESVIYRSIVRVCVLVCVCARVCVCVREREREREGE